MIDTPQILVVDDDPSIRSGVVRALERAGMKATAVGDGAGALAAVKSGAFDLVLLDMRLPDASGLALCNTMTTTYGIAVMMITAVGDEASIVRALDSGADDYLRKPFGTDELLARVRSVLRRSQPPERAQAPLLTIGSLILHMKSNRAQMNDASVQLTPTEHHLLAYLAQRAGQVVSRAELLDVVWGTGYQEEHHLLQVTVSRLRRKLSGISETELIHTYTGAGYEFATPTELLSASPGQIGAAAGGPSGNGVATSPRRTSSLD
jgi:two-component system KDP operon response regulator KdpE